MLLRVEKQEKRAKGKLWLWFRTGRETLKALVQMSLLAFRAQPLCFFALVLLQGLQGLLPLLSAWMTKIIFDLLAQGLQGHASPAMTQGLWLALLAQALLLICGAVMSPANQYLNAELTRKLTLSMKSMIYRKINTLVSLEYFENSELHDIIQVTANNAQIGPLQALNTFTAILQGLITLFSFVGVLIAFNPLFVVLISLAVIPQLYAQLKLSHKRFSVVMTNSPRERKASYYGQVLTIADFVKELRLFHLGDYFLGKFIATTEDIYREQQSEQQQTLRWQALLSLLTGGISTLVFVLVVMQAFAGRLSLGDVALYTSAIASIQVALTSLILALSRSNDGVLFFRQYTQLLALGESPQTAQVSYRPLEPLTSGITLRDVSFRYSEQHPWTLRHLNLFLPAHQCLALVGLNGSGKTTLVKLLTRLYEPSEGAILWDGIDIREFDPIELRQKMGAIFQDFTRYDLSVQENIGLGQVEHIEDLERIQQVATKAGIDERIQALPQGYQSILSKWLAPKDEGVDFSGGEWQKVALARMFMRDSQLLILDEPSAALDAEAEYELYQHFKQLMQGHTCLLITHRFSTVRMADTIAVLEKGQITEVGTHTDLITHNQTYARFYTIQAESYQ